MASKEDYTFFHFRINSTVDTVTWPRAKDVCARRGMKLLAPRTPQEADRFVETLLPLTGNDSEILNITGSELNIFL
ncbi:hypothetical protein ElyMa_000357000, partial [Elysia marginata]